MKQTQTPSEKSDALRKFEESAEEFGLAERFSEKLPDLAPKGSFAVLERLFEIADKSGYRLKLSLIPKDNMLKNISYSRIVSTLTKNYISIYYVDMDTNRYVEYSSDPHYQELNIKTSGENFFDDLQKNVYRVIHPEDSERIAAYFRKENLISELEGGKTFSVSYRLLLDGIPVYVNLKALYLEDGTNQHVLIGVSNIDALKKREETYKQELGYARRMATMDALTGVRNKHAYIDFEETLDAQIRTKKPLRFAVAVFDVNNLKRTNDTFGHQAGDLSIREACTNICNIFCHSAVFRVGGDEFAAILQGKDYEKRAELFVEMDALSRANLACGKVVVACGISDFDPERDADVASVFTRADAAMYLHKKDLKKRDGQKNEPRSGR